MTETGKKENEVVSKVVFGYGARPLRSGQSPFQLLYEVKPKIFAKDKIGGTSQRARAFCEIELLAMLGP